MKFTFAGESEEAQLADQEDEVTALVAEVNLAATELAEAKRRHDELKAALVKTLDDRGERSLYVSIDGKAYKATVVRSERAKVDEEELRKAIGARKFNAITVRKVSMEMLTWAMSTGKIDPAVASQHITLVPSSAYPKITEVEGAISSDDDD
jgi:hypothetical protein